MELFGARFRVRTEVLIAFVFELGLSEFFPFLRSAENNTIEIWQDMLEEGIQPALSTYFRVIKGLMRTNRLSELLYFFQDMKHRGFLPTTGLYNMAIYACGNAKEIEKAYVFSPSLVRLLLERISLHALQVCAL